MAVIVQIVQGAQRLSLVHDLLIVVTHHHFKECGRQIKGRILFLQHPVLDDADHLVQIAVADVLLNTVQRLFRLYGCDIVQGRDRLRDNTGLAVALDFTQLIDLAAHHQAECLSLAAGAAGTPDPVDIIFVVLRDIVVKYRLYVVHVDSSGRHIRRHQNIGSSVTEAVHHAIPLHLLQIPVQPFCIVAPALQLFDQLVHLLLRIAEYDGEFRIIQIQQTAHHFHLILGLDLIIILRHLRNRQLLFHDLDELRVLLKLLCDLCNRLRHGGRKHHGLAFLGKLA